jgi:hypothetical protein
LVVVVMYHLELVVAFSCTVLAAVRLSRSSRRSMICSASYGTCRDQECGQVQRHTSHIAKGYVDEQLFTTASNAVKRGHLAVRNHWLGLLAQLIANNVLAQLVTREIGTSCSHSFP